MAKSKQLEEALAQLDAVRAEPTTPEAIGVIRKLLRGKVAIAAANAAKLVGEAELRELVPDLLAAFPHWMEDPVKRDPGCTAKFRIAEALYRLEVQGDEVFLQGIRHVQMEPVWGGQQDTACSLRNVCALGLVKSGYPDMMLELADLLADPQPLARSGALRALAYSGRIEAIALVRFKVQVGDPELAVIGDSFAALLEIAPTSSLPVLAKFLTSKSLLEEIQQRNSPQSVAIAEMAALAIGEAQPAGAFELLHSFWQRTTVPELRKSALLAIAMLRDQPSIALLKTVLKEGAISDAIAALEALKLYQSDPNLWEVVEMLVEQRMDNQLLQLLQTKSD
jgi:HEAT repeat protein